jgi:hypothetical protein
MLSECRQTDLGSFFRRSADKSVPASAAVATQEACQARCAPHVCFILPGQIGMRASHGGLSLFGRSRGPSDYKQRQVYWNYLSLRYLASPSLDAAEVVGQPANAWAVNSRQKLWPVVGCLCAWGY